MAFEFKLDLEAAKSNMTGGKGFNTGCTKAKVLGIFPKKSSGGNDVVDIILENENGGKAVIFGMMSSAKTVTGKDNPHYARFMELAYHAGIRQGTIGSVVRKAGGTDTPSEAFVEATGKIITVALQTVFDINNKNNNQTENWQISKTFDTTGRTIESVEKSIQIDDSASFEVKDYYTPGWTSAKAGGTLIIPTGENETTEIPQATTAEAPSTGKMF